MSNKYWLLVSNITYVVLIITSVCWALIGEYNRAIYELLFAMLLLKLIENKEK